MSDDSNKSPMLEMYLFETSQQLEQLEQLVLDGEKNGLQDSINEAFRIMHSIKGSSAMMFFNEIASLAHSLEDLFSLLRQNGGGEVDYLQLTDIVLECIDFIKVEVEQIENGYGAHKDSTELSQIIRSFLANLQKSASSAVEIPKTTNSMQQRYYIDRHNSPASIEENYYRAVVHFEEGCEMENIRAFTLVHNLNALVENLQYFPPDIVENNDTVETIRHEGFELIFTSHCPVEKLRKVLEDSLFLKSFHLEVLENEIISKKQIILDDPYPAVPPKVSANDLDARGTSKSVKQSLISVNVEKIDCLLDLVGELVIAEAMVTRNPDLNGLALDGFNKAARQLRKITNELQDIVMSVRMVPLSATFQRMNRIVRDMSRKLSKEVGLEIIGEDTEVDKNIIEKISDPLMHLIRNAIDHGIESGEERRAQGKPVRSKLTLKAKNAGGDVWITVKDDGKGLNREKILHRAKEHGLVYKPDNEMSDNEIYSFILLPGFSTNDNVTEFSGRGVGMDVVAKNIERLGGSIILDSQPGNGTTISIKIPLTLAIVDGMIIKVGNSVYAIPTTSIKESFCINQQDIIKDPDKREMVLIRGQVHPIVRLHEFYHVKAARTKLEDGIIIMVEDGGKCMCLFADTLLGEQQVVIKALPKYIKKIKGLAGCTLLGDGSISLVLDIADLIQQAG